MPARLRGASRRGLLRVPRLGEVMGQQLRLDLGGSGKPLLQDLGDAGVELLAPALEQAP